jgi:hypothetical protein
MKPCAWVWIVATLISSSAAAQTAPARELVIPFENVTREARVFWLTEGSAVILSDDLTALGVPAITRDDRLRAFDRLRVPQVASLSLATVIRLGQLVGASQVVIGSFELQRDNIQVKARTIRLDTGRMSAEIAERGPLSDLFNVYARVARRIAPDSPVTTEQMEQLHPPLTAFEQYIKGLLADDSDAQVTFLTQAIRLYPAFHRARVALWGVHNEAGDHLPALALIRQVPDTHWLGRQAR